MLKKLVLPFDEKFEIHINTFLNAQENHLFNEPAYFKLHSKSDKDCYAQLVRFNDRKVCATLAFHEVTNGVYVSPGRGTYGGPSLNAKLQFMVVEKFLYTVTDYLRQKGARCIRIRLAPASHDNPLFAISFNALTRYGYHPDKHEVNFEMLINDEQFVSRIDYGNIKRIRKAEREGFICEQVNTSLLPSVHQLIAENRVRLGASVSMSLDQLNKMIDLFPKRLNLFAVYRDSARLVMVAAAVCLELTQRVLYVLYWGDADGMRSYSPVALLASNIYAFSKERGYLLLDVGTSTLNGVPNHGLVKFKRNLGFSESLKLEMVWTKLRS